MAAEGLALAIQILGINPEGHESGNVSICDGRDLPWLQEPADVSVWDSWEVTYRDVIVVDEANEKASVYNLTTYDLAVPANYEAMKALIREEAAAAE